MKTDTWTSQREAVHTIMADGQWHTEEDIRARLGLTAGSSITTRIRELRKPEFGGWEVTCEFIVGTRITRYRRGSSASKPFIPFVFGEDDPIPKTKKSKKTAGDEYDWLVGLDDEAVHDILLDVQHVW